ncbi:MAG: aldehyde dehydrogenase family protein [Acidimicrobiia bacterium]
MSTLSDREVLEIIQRVRSRFSGGGDPDRPAASAAAAAAVAEAPQRGGGIYPTVDTAVQAANDAFQAYRGVGLAGRRAIIDSIRRVMTTNAETLARMAREETGLGRVSDKIRKNLLVTRKTPGPEDLDSTVVTGDEGMMMTEFAPYGVVAAITPTTNPTSTIINNTIAILSAGNTVTYNVHPNAKRVSAHNIRLINDAVTDGGGPADLVTAVPDPTVDSAKDLMHHPLVRLLLVTGGPGVVEEALKTNKRAVTAGPGNPPAVVDETADVDTAGRDIVAGASFDNNLICTDEKTTVVLDAVADRLLQSMSRNGAYVLKEHELRRLERVVFTELGGAGKPGRVDGRWIGKDAAVILGEIGVRVPDDVRLVVAEVPNEHSLVWTEQMMPVMPVTRVRTIEDAIDLAVRSEHGFRHTASIHSSNVDTITAMARAINCSIFVANGPNYAGLGQGGEGFTSFSIASPTGDGLTRPRTFSRERRVTVVGALRIV